MNKKYIRNGLEYYMEIEWIGGADYEYQMLKENQIANLLPLQTKNINQQQYLIYATAGMKPVWITIDNMWITGRQFYSIVDNLIKTIEELKRYFLVADNIVLEKDCLFIDINQFQLYILYVPGYQKDIFTQITKLMEYLFERIDHRDIEGVMFAYGLHRLLKKEITDIQEIRNYLKSNTFFPVEEQKIYDRENKTDMNFGFTEKESFLGQPIPEYKIDKSEIEKEKSEYEFSEAGQKIEQKNEIKGRAGKIIFFGLLWVLLFCGAGGILYLIYWYGIEEWKRNVLLFILLCISVDSIFLIIQCKKEKQRKEAASVFQGYKENIPYRQWEKAADFKPSDSEKTMSFIQQEGKEEVLPGQNKKTSCNNQKEKIDLVELDETMILCSKSKSESNPKLIYTGHGNSYEIILTKFPFLIGSYPSRVDYQIREKQISRFHVSFSYEKGNYMVKDLHSTNGTFVNGKRVEDGEEWIIHSGDCIYLADLSFKFEADKLV